MSPAVQPRSETNPWQERYYRRFYDSSRGWRDGTTEFHEMCAAHGRDAGKILEVGAGPSNPTSSYLATLGALYGVDVDPDVAGNDALTEARVFDGNRIPYEDATFGACVSNYVVEHVADPRSHLQEIARVLRPGAAYLFRTPNRFHYVSLASALTPHWFHVRVANRLRGLPQDSHDPYPTHYRMNSVSAVRRHASEAGLRVDELRMIEKDPFYGRSSRALFLAFTAYERVVNSTELLRGLRSNIFAVLRKG